MKQPTRRPVIVPLCSLLALLAAACAGESAQPAEDLVRPIRAVKIGDTEELDRNWFPGRAQATKEVNVSFDVPGKIIEFPVDVGDVVEAGQLLARLDASSYENDLTAAKAQLEQARAYRERIEQASETGAVAQQDVTDARARFDVAQANVQIKQERLDDTRITSPLSGNVAATYVENFQNVAAKQEVARILDISRIEMKIDIPESGISLLPYATDVVCRFEAVPGVEIPAEISEVGTEAAETTRTYPVTLVMEQPEGITILPGMAGAATWRVEAPADLGEDGFEIPLTALLRAEDGSSAVWVLDEDSMTVSRRAVELGRLTARGVLATGVAADEWVATAGVYTLQEGQRVRLPGGSR